MTTPPRRGYLRSWLPPLLVLTVVLTGGCDKQDAQTTEIRNGQTVAQVDGQDITVHQLNYRLRNVLGGQQGVDEQAATDAAARHLVDRELLVKRAMAAKRDREPNVMVAIEETRKDILAAAYLEGIADGAAPPTDTELLDYYDKHPLKYAQRKLYLVRQILTDNSVTRGDVETFAKQSPTAEQLAAWLQSRGTKFLVTVHTWAVDQLPDTLGQRLQTLRKGHAIMVAAADGLSINYLVDVRDAPQTFEQAKEAIAKTLLDERRRALQEAEIERLRKEAAITWYGEFRERQTATAPAAETPAAPDATQAPAATSDAAPTEPAADPPNEDDASSKSLDEGIKGLR